MHAWGLMKEDRVL